MRKYIIYKKLMFLLLIFKLQGLNEERAQMIGNINALKGKLDMCIQKNREFEKILRDIESQKAKLEKQESLLKSNCDQVFLKIN